MVQILSSVIRSPGGGFKLGQSEAGGEQQKRKKEGGVAFPHIPVIFWCGSSSGV